MNLRILHTNDLHGHLKSDRLARLRDLRAQADLYLDSGDAVAYGNVAIPFLRDPVWEAFDALGLDAQVPGNREFHPLAPAMRGKFRGARHPIVCANLFDRRGGRPFPPSILLERGGLRIGIVGAMVQYYKSGDWTGKLADRAFTDPVAAANEEGERIRPECDLLIALTHIGLKRDRLIAETGPFDLLFGGHSHDRVPPTRIGGCTIVQSGSHARTAGVYGWDGRGLTGGIVSLAA